MQNIFETERLLLRQFTLDDSPFILKLLNTDTWLRFIGDRKIKSLEDAKQYLINGPIKSYQTNGYGLSLVALKDSGEPIGMCGILKRDTLNAPDIGYALLPEYEGQGYAYEIAKATLTYALQTLCMPQILAITKGDNDRSVKLLHKLGFKFEKMLKLNPDDQELMLFAASV